MAKPKKSVSTTQPEGETGPGHRWWRSPAIIGPILVAIIGGIAAISVAVIQRTAPKPTASAPTTIEQRTHGAGSPAVGHTGGNVTIQQQDSGGKP
jgi:hypothetical protein